HRRGTSSNRGIPPGGRLSPTAETWRWSRGLRRKQVRRRREPLRRGGRAIPKCRRGTGGAVLEGCVAIQGDWRPFRIGCDGSRVRRAIPRHILGKESLSVGQVGRTTGSAGFVAAERTLQNLVEPCRTNLAEPCRTL